MAGGVHKRVGEEKHPRPPCVDRQRAVAARGEETGPWDVEGDRLGRVTQIRQAELQGPWTSVRPSRKVMLYSAHEHVHAHVERTASADGEVGKLVLNSLDGLSAAAPATSVNVAIAPHTTRIAIFCICLSPCRVSPTVRRRRWYSTDQPQAEWSALRFSPCLRRSVKRHFLANTNATVRSAARAEGL